METLADIPVSCTLEKKLPRETVQYPGARIVVSSDKISVTGKDKRAVEIHGRNIRKTALETRGGALCASIDDGHSVVFLAATRAALFGLLSTADEAATKALYAMIRDVQLHWRCETIKYWMARLGIIALVQAPGGLDKESLDVPPSRVAGILPTTDNEHFVACFFCDFLPHNELQYYVNHKGRRLLQLDLRTTGDAPNVPDDVWDGLLGADPRCKQLIYAGPYDADSGSWPTLDACLSAKK